MTRFLRILVPLLFAATAFADSADLFMARSSPQDFRISFALVNHGPDPARNVVVTMDVPEALTIRRASVGSHSCDTTTRPVRCVVGDLHVGLPANYSGLELVAPIADATYTVTVTATSDTPDPKAGNHTITETWSTRIEADLSVLLLAGNPRVEPGQTARFPWFVCNNITNNAVPRDVRVDFSVTNAVFETIKPPPGFTCTLDGASAVCTAETYSGDCPYDLELTVRTSSDRLGGAARVTARVSSSIPEKNPDNNRYEAKTAIYRWIVVENTADSGPGSLRTAIDDANANCSPGPCRIAFEIPGPVPPEGWFTITPQTPLPAITADRVRIEGSTQTNFTGPTNTKGPEIAIDGRLAGSGLKMLGRCEGVVEGLALGNFGEDQGLWLSTNGWNTPHCRAGESGTDSVNVSFNHIGVDPSGTVPWPNLRGLRLDGASAYITGNRIRFNHRAGVWMWRGSVYLVHNWIESNGASGVFFGPEASAVTLGNTIARNGQMGIAVARGVQSVDLRRNSYRNNGGLGIDWGLDGISPSDADDRNGPTNAPVVLSGHYDAAKNQTIVSVTVKSSPLPDATSSSGLLDFFANDAPDGQGERHIGFVWGQPGQAVVATFPGNYRGQWINATFTRLRGWEHGPWMTSEVSNTVRIE